MELTLK
jgi:hypothetical protein